MPANQPENRPQVPEEPQTFDPEWRTKLVEALAKIPEEREKHIEELEALLPSLNTFDLLGWVSLRNLLIDPEKYREGENGGMALRVEYLTLLSLVRGFNEGTGAMPNLNDLQVVGDLTDKICSSKALEAMQLRLARPMEGAEAELADLANAAYLNELFVRVPGFPQHHEAVIRGLFKPFDAELRRDLGFGPEEAITLAHALKVRLQRVFDARMDAARSSASRLEKFAKLRRRGKLSEMAGVPDELLLSYARLSDRDLRRAARGMTRTVEMATMGDLLAFSLEDLSTEAGVSAEATKRFLEAFTLDFQAVDPKYRYPEVLHPLKHKPLIRHGERHFAPIPDQLLWAFQPLFERTLLNTPLRQRFNSHRHDWLLEEGCRLLTRIMPRIQLDTNLRYPKPKGVQGDVAELDALGRYDSALFFIEAKGASLRDKGKQGTPHVFRDEIEKILEAAHEQAFRAYEHAVGGGEFVRSDGTRMSAVLGGTTRVFLIALTLEPLGFLTARMDARNPFSASSNHGLLAVNVHDLMAMADCLDGYPAWFTHYLTRRGRMAQQGFLSAAEELDLFCYYMERGLYHKGPQDFGDADQVTLGTWTDKLDEYYFYLNGSRKAPAACPHPKASADLLSFAERLEASGVPGGLDGMLAVIDLSEDGRRDFFESRGQARERNRRDGRAHDFRMQATGVWGITYATGSPVQLRELGLPSYVDKKLKETGAPYWVAIAETSGRSPEFTEVFVHGRPAPGDEDAPSVNRA